MVEFCRKCVMPSTRPGIKFVDGVCQGCLTAEQKAKTDWNQRMSELEALCNTIKAQHPHGYNCAVAVSSGKDSWYQVHVMKELMHMNVVLLTVEDNFPSTKAGEHNIKALSEVFGCNIISIKPDIALQKKLMRYMFEKHGMPTWYVDWWIYKYPPALASALNIPLLVYGENVSYEYGGADAVETPSADAQFKNSVASEQYIQEIIDAGLATPEDFAFGGPITTHAIYLAYYTNWNAHEHYLFAKSRGFWDLSVKDKWNRSHMPDNYTQIDSRAYLVHPWMKYPKFGHATTTDIVSRQIRYGLKTREEGIQLVRERDGKLDYKCIQDFCAFLGYSELEFWQIVDSFYNRELFEQKDGDWVLKHPIWEA